MSIHPPLAGRAAKPRATGLTMVIDKGLGPGQVSDLLLMASNYIDFIKLGFGTSLLYPPEVLKRKLQAIVERRPDVVCDAVEPGLFLCR